MLRTPALLTLSAVFLLAYCDTTSAIYEQLQYAPLDFIDYGQAPFEQPSDISSNYHQAVPIPDTLMPTWRPLGVNDGVDSSQIIMDSEPVQQPGMDQLSHSNTYSFIPTLYSQVPTAELHPSQDWHWSVYANYPTVVPQPWVDQSYHVNSDPLLVELPQISTDELSLVNSFDWLQFSNEESDLEQSTDHDSVVPSTLEPSGSQTSAYVPPAMPSSPNSMDHNPLPDRTSNAHLSADGEWQTTNLTLAVPDAALREAIKIELDRMPEPARPNSYVMVDAMGYHDYGRRLVAKKLPGKYKTEKNRISPAALPIELAAYWIKGRIMDLVTRYIAYNSNPDVLHSEPAKFPSLTCNSLNSPPLTTKYISGVSKLLSSRFFAFGLYQRGHSRQLHSFRFSAMVSAKANQVMLEHILKTPTSNFRVCTVKITDYHTMAAEILRVYLLTRSPKKKPRSGP